MAGVELITATIAIIITTTIELTSVSKLCFCLESRGSFCRMRPVPNGLVPDPQE